MCMLIDGYSRTIDYLRISIADRCNLRCIYCMPKDGVVHKPASEILSFEEIIRLVRVCTTLGISKIKISGGEPLIRKGCSELLESLISLPNIKDVSLTTNGVLVKKYIKELKSTGLKRMNISVDTLDARKFRRIAGQGKLADVLSGIDAAIENGFFIKLNVVMMNGINDNEILEFAKFACEKKIIIRFIELMPMIDNRLLSREIYMPCEAVKNKLQSLGSLKPVHTESLGNGPARYFKIEDTSLVVGFVSPIGCKFCSSCNRIRLTSAGFLLPCLAHNYGVDLKSSLRIGAGPGKISGLIKDAVSAKPKEHLMELNKIQGCAMAQVGG